MRLTKKWSSQLRNCPFCPFTPPLQQSIISLWKKGGHVFPNYFLNHCCLIFQSYLWLTSYVFQKFSNIAMNQKFAITSLSHQSNSARSTFLYKHAECAMIIILILLILSLPKYPKIEKN